MTFIPLITINIKLLGHEVISRYRLHGDIYPICNLVLDYIWDEVD